MVVSNEVLEERYSNMEKQNEKEHKALFKAMERIWDTMQNFIDSADDKYASKDRVNKLETQIATKAKTKANVKIEFIKTRGAIIVAIIWFAGLYLAN